MMVNDNLYSLFAEFFQNKVMKIIEYLNVLDSIYFEIPPIFFDTHWSYFNLPTSYMEFSFISCLKSNSPLDPLNLLLSLSSYLMYVITVIIRLSVSSLIVSQLNNYAYIMMYCDNACTNAIMHSDFKKHNLVPSKLSNYFPVSQLSLISKI